MPAATLIDSVRFGPIEVPDDRVIEFPLGLIGLGGHQWTLLDRNPGSGFLWLHSLDDGALALPVADPRRFFAEFELRLGEEDRTRIGAEDPALAEVYVTVRAASDPTEILANLRAPLVVWNGRGHQVINTAPGAELQVPLLHAA
ncbi:MAG TPA: flagellar assembly protein FliW [Solirubrobacteraceae bacterium]|nr:flagellar assembly protein FliW [Solirubrobacteraceae bacterium]